MEHRSSTVFFHCSLSWACPSESIWVYYRPICSSYCSADLFQLLSGLSRFRFPWGFQKSAFWLPCYVVFLTYGRSTSTSFFWFGSSASLPGILLMGLRCWWWSAIFPNWFYICVAKILSLVLKDFSLNLHTGLSTWKAVLALPILNSHLVLFFHQQLSRSLGK